MVLVILRTQGPSCLSVPMLLVILGVCAAALSRLSFRLWRLLAEAREAQPSQGNVCALWEAGIDRSRHRSGGWPSFASGVWWWQRGVGALAGVHTAASADRWGAATKLVGPCTNRRWLVPTLPSPWTEVSDYPPTE